MSGRQRWTSADVPDQDGRVAVITGANSGIGWETAKVLAGRGAAVVLACRDIGRAKDAAARIQAADLRAAVGVVRLDLASLASVREAAEEIVARHQAVDLLVNNAGLMWTPHGRTEDGFEQQFGVNHLGHFALTGLLLGHMSAVPGSRVVTVSSNGHRQGRMDFDDLQSERAYNRVAAYGRSKLANLMFTYELQDRLAAAGARTAALAAHPGGVQTDLLRHAPAWFKAVNWAIGGLVTHDAAAGALPTLRAATDPAAKGGEYYGPDGRFATTGHPVRVSSNARSHEGEARRRLWRESERLTGVTFPV
ncbi:oxidoreductase [Microbispora sp. NPDC049125]|uniref:oxidoreductase n=1 Tax=Microbispora sp. NPDC049125 TaxID=3154929 RepID=UPI0034673F5D